MYLAGERRMLAAELLDIHPAWHAVGHAPFTGDHDAVGAMSAAQDDRRQRIRGTGESEFVKLEEGKIGLFARRNRANVAATKAARRALRCPAQGIEMSDRCIVGKAVDHQRVAYAFHKIGTIVRR